jgi:hypothetical protein
MKTNNQIVINSTFDMARMTVQCTNIPHHWIHMIQVKPQTRICWRSLTSCCVMCEAVEQNINLQLWLV